jgi:hypothetical protein
MYLWGGPWFSEVATCELVTWQVAHLCYVSENAVTYDRMRPSAFTKC